MTDIVDSLDSSTGQGSANRESTARGAAWSTAAYASMGLGQILVQRVLNGSLTTSEFGVVNATLIVIGFGRIFTMSGVGPALVQRKTVERRHIVTGFIISMMMGLAAVGVLCLIAPWIGSFFHSDQLVNIMRVISLTFLIQAGGIVAEGLLQRDLRFKSLAIAEIISFVVGFIGVGVGAAAMGAGVWSLVYANMAQAAIKVVLVLMAARHPIGRTFDRSAAKDLARFASGFTLAKIFNYAAINGDNSVVGNRMGTVALGVYGKAYQLLAYPAMLFGQVVDRVLFPLMAREQEDIPKLARTYRRGVAGIATVTGPGGALICVLAPEILDVFAGPGPKWQPAISPLRVFAVGLFLRTGYKISDSLARSSGNVFKRAKRQAVYAVAVIVGALVGSHWSITGAAIGVLAALLLNYVLMADLSLRTTQITWGSFIEAHRRGAILGVLTGVVASSIAVPLRHAHVHYLLILIATLAGAAGMFVLLIMVRRDLVLGDVEWLLAGRRSSTAATSANMTKKES